MAICTKYCIGILNIHQQARVPLQFINVSQLYFVCFVHISQLIGTRFQKGFQPANFRTLLKYRISRETTGIFGRGAITDSSQKCVLAPVISLTFSGAQKVSDGARMYSYQFSRYLLITVNIILRCWALIFLNQRHIASLINPVMTYLISHADSDWQCQSLGRKHNFNWFFRFSFIFSLVNGLWTTENLNLLSNLQDIEISIS